MNKREEAVDRLYDEGRQLYYARKFSESEDVWIKLTRDQKYGAVGEYGLGILYYALNKLDAAEDRFKKCLEGELFDEWERANVFSRCPRGGMFAYRSGRR